MHPSAPDFLSVCLYWSSDYQANRLTNAALPNGGTSHRSMKDSPTKEKELTPQFYKKKSGQGKNLKLRVSSYLHIYR